MNEIKEIFIAYSSDIDETGFDVNNKFYDTLDAVEMCATLLGL